MTKDETNELKRLIVSNVPLRTLLTKYFNECIEKQSISIHSNIADHAILSYTLGIEKGIRKVRDDLFSA